MTFRCRFVLPVVATGLALMVAPTLAARPASRPTPRAHAIAPSMGGHTAKPSTASCQVGIIDGSQAWEYVLFPPEDEYLTMLDPAVCSCGPNSSTTITAVHWKLYWPTSCNSIPVTIRLLGAVQDGSDPTCWRPDPTNVLAGPFTESLDGSTVGFVDHTFTESFPALTVKAFIGFTLGDGGDCPVTQPGDPVAVGYLTSPLLASDMPDPPTPGLSCVSYNVFPGSTPNGYDLVVDYGVTGNSTIWVDTDCVTPANKRSWGQLKALYR